MCYGVRRPKLQDEQDANLHRIAILLARSQPQNEEAHAQQPGQRHATCRPTRNESSRPLADTRGAHVHA